MTDGPAPDLDQGASSRELLEHASPNSLSVAPELRSQARLAADTTLPLTERLTAFENITESEVGDTSFTRARNVEREFGLRQVYLKFEGNNPSGTQKDRIAFAQAMDAVRRGYDAVTLATCGNYGVAMALAASVPGLRCEVYVPAAYHTNRIAEIEQLGAHIVRVPGSYEDAVAASQAAAVERDLYDANPGGNNTLLQLRAYGEIAYEIYDELRDAPAIVALPVSNGTTLAGVYAGFVSLHRRGKTSRIPRLVAGSAYHKNPIVAAHRRGLTRCADLSPAAVRETAINEPLVNWHSIDGDLALAALNATGGSAVDVSDRTLLSFGRLLRAREGLMVLPASTAGLAAMLQIHRESPLPGDRYVVVLTGRKS